MYPAAKWKIQTAVRMKDMRVCMQIGSDIVMKQNMKEMKLTHGWHENLRNGSGQMNKCTAEVSIELKSDLMG